MTPRDAAHTAAVNRHGAAAGAEAPHAAIPRPERAQLRDAPPDVGVAPGVVERAPAAPLHPNPAPTSPAAQAGASGGVVGVWRSGPSATGVSEVEPTEGARQAPPGERRGAQSGPGGDLLIPSAGVDSLYASAVGAPAAHHLASAKERKAAAAAGDAAVVWAPEGAGRAFVVRPHGWRGYTIWATSPAMDVCLGEGRSLPALYLWLQAAHLHRVGVEVAVEEAERVRAAVVREPEHRRDPDGEWPSVNEHGLPPLPQPAPRALGAALTASRVDLYVDTQGWEPQREDFPRFITRARRKTEYETDRQMHTRGRRLSGFTFGRGAIVCRVYDKTLELAQRGETWPRVIWQGAALDRPVWRVELQFRRSMLKRFSLRTVADVLASRQALWEYGMEWISLRDPSPDTNRSRWPEAPVWTALRQSRLGSPCCELVAERRQAAAKLRLLRGFVGYASSLAACEDVEDLGDALDGVVPEVQAYLARRGTTFEDVVAVKREQRLHA